MLYWGITIIVLALGLWIYSVYLSWQASVHTPFTPITPIAVLPLYMRLERLLRRGWYAFRLQTRKVGIWSGKHAEHAFVKVFPGAAPAFSRYDNLTGRQQGPSSYFLKSLSTRSQTIRRSTRSKKLI